MPALVLYLLVFLAVSVVFLYFHMMMGSVLRPNRPSAEKATIYECGEPTIGSAWIQFDLRFYVVALLFVIFDVEVAFFFPWAVVFGQANAVAQQTSEPETADERQAYEAHKSELNVQNKDVAKTSEAARSLAWMALFDILVFFGVLLVGFAYLWKR